MPAASSEKGQNKQQAWDMEFPENDNIPCTPADPTQTDVAFSTAEARGGRGRWCDHHPRQGYF